MSVTTPEGAENDKETGSNLSVPTISGTESSQSSSQPTITLTDTDGTTLDSHPDPNVTIPAAGTMNGDGKGSCAKSA